MLYKIKHYSSSILTRCNILLELRRSQERGNKLPKSIFIRAWKEPHIHEEYVWLLRFLDTSESVQLIDIGANVGYWSELFIEYFPHTKMLAFEPVKRSYLKNKERYIGNNNVNVYNVALGSKIENKDINVAIGDGLTSFLNYDYVISDRNKHFEGIETVRIDKLNNYINDIDSKDRIVVCKIDIQGFEVEALKGGEDVLDLISLMIVECSFVQEFKGQEPTFSAVCEILSKHDLFPVHFGTFDYSKGPIGWERNVLFIKSNYLNDTWGY